MSRWPILLLVLCAAALGLAACGGDDEDAQTILSKTFGEGQDVKSGRLDVSLRLNAQGLQQVNGPIGMQLAGPFQSAGKTELPRFDFNATVDAGGQQIKAGAVSTGEKGFVRLQDQAYDVGADLYKQFKDGYAQTAKCNADNDKSSNSSFAALGISPGKWVSDAEKAGEEKVGGADTTHVTGTVDVPKFLEDINRVLARSTPQAAADPCAKEGEEQSSNQPKPRQLSAADRKQIAEAVKNARIDVWSGKEDRTLRRMNVTLKFAVPQAEQEKAGGLKSGDLRFDMTIGALNEKQTIKSPSGARPLEELTAALGGAVPQGASSGAGGASSGDAAAQQQQQQPQQQQQGGTPYEQCLNEAGQDVMKLQECQALVGQ